MPKRTLPVLAFTCVFSGVLGASLFGFSPLRAQPANQDDPPVVLGREAPLWEVSQWENLPGDTDTLEVDDFEFKTIYLYCFQSW